MDKLEIKIIPDNRMIPIAVSAVQEYARYYLKSEKDVRAVGLALEESIANITEHLAGNRQYPLIVTANADNGDLVLTVTDRELPGSFETVLTDEDALGLNMMQKLMDEVKVEYLGMDGRRQTLVKHLTTPPALLPNFDFTPEEVEAEGDRHSYTLREPTEEEMLEIVRMLYNEYGNSYDVEGAYFPEHHWQNILNDRAYFLVAVADNGEIAGNLTISRMSYMPGIWDISMAFAKERYRKGSLLKRLTGELLDYAHSRGDIDGLFTEATVVHPYTQKAFNHYGLMPVGFTLSMMPDTIYQPKIGAHVGRGSFAEAMCMFVKNKKTVYVRPEQKDFLADIAASLGLEREIITQEQDFLHDKTEVEEEYVKVLDTGYIYFNAIGRDFAAELKRIDTDIRRHGGLTNEILLNADDPACVFATNEAVRQGYFCVRYMPCPQGRDYVVYAKMYSDPVDYAGIATTSPYTEMLERVRRFDPEQQP